MEPNDWLEEIGRQVDLAFPGHPPVRGLQDARSGQHFFHTEPSHQRRTLIVEEKFLDITHEEEVKEAQNVLARIPDALRALRVGGTLRLTEDGLA